MQVKQHPETTALLFDKGMEYLRQGNYSGAIEVFDRSIKLNPNDAHAHGHRCVARHRVGDMLGAIDDCRSAAALYLEKGNMKDFLYALKMLKKLQGGQSFNF
jgi:Flp pilus assembly protein TadD